MHKVLITSKGSCGYHGSENGRPAKGCLFFIFSASRLEEIRERTGSDG